METEVRRYITTETVYWVTDNEGVRHLYHDRLAAQLAEERYARERSGSEH